MTYTIWFCCNHFDTYEELDECIGMAAAAMNSDGSHAVLAVEGPNGEDLMAAAEKLDDERSEIWREQIKVSPKPIGDIIIQGPKDCIEGKEVIYSDNERARQMLRYITIYGASRVKWVPRPN